MVTEIYISETDYDTFLRGAILDALVASTASTKSYLTFTAVGGNNTAVIFSVTASTDNGTYRTLTVGYNSGLLPTNGQLRGLTFARTGDNGAQGAQGPQGSADSGTLTTKGDLLTRSSSALVRLPVGATNGHVLTVDSAQTAGIKWAAVVTDEDQNILAVQIFS